MDHGRLEEDIRRMTLQLETYAKLSEMEHSDRGSILLDELRSDFRKLSADILQLSSEADRNGLLDQIIKALQNVGMIATAAKALVDILQS